MSARINHVSINARDLRESVDFYVELLGAELVPTPNFGLPVQWLALGRTQLHLFERDLKPTSHHHHGLERLPDDIRAQVKGLWEFNPQTPEQMRGRLFVPG